ncbi:MAG: respiratory nitrate reductase subunit gamma [Actinobacteria bacterium]|nr:respiratory nitrate reductase subunit gamma [Actinomycetota bacterium]
MTSVTFHTLLWVVFPYMVMVAFIGGHIWRWRFDQFGWTTRSSQMYESKLLRIGSPMFHFGILAVFFGHVIGLCIPEEWTDAIGISDHIYHWGALVLGIGAAMATIGGLLILLFRRRTNSWVFGVTTVMDKAMYLLLSAVLTLGMLATVVVSTGWSGSHYDYREGVSIWFRQVWSFHPSAASMANAPLLYQLHALAALCLFAIWPFTRLVHVFSVPLGYLTRPYIVYRSRGSAKKARRGWESIDF